MCLCSSWWWWWCGIRSSASHRRWCTSSKLKTILKVVSKTTNNVSKYIRTYGWAPTVFVLHLLFGEHISLMLRAPISNVYLSELCDSWQIQEAIKCSPNRMQRKKHCTSKYAENPSVDYMRRGKVCSTSPVFSVSLDPSVNFEWLQVFFWVEVVSLIWKWIFWKFNLTRIPRAQLRRIAIIRNLTELACCGSGSISVLLSKTETRRRRISMHQSVSKTIASKCFVLKQSCAIRPSSSLSWSQWGYKLNSIHLIFRCIKMCG